MLKDYTNLKINTYNEFVTIVEEIGFMPLSNNCIDFISLSSDKGLTVPEQWHTGLPSDPWSWRTKIEEEKKAAYAKLFDKKPGFISLAWYPIFLAARRKNRSFAEMYADGLLSSYAKRIYNQFDHYESLAVHELKGMCGITKEDHAKFESALIELQMKMFLTINGMTNKLNKEGQPYGWPVTLYAKVETWAGEDLIEKSKKINPQDAVEEIMDRIYELNPNADSKKVKKFIG